MRKSRAGGGLTVNAASLCNHGKNCDTRFDSKVLINAEHDYLEAFL
jgi:hypothetical protein